MFSLNAEPMYIAKKNLLCPPARPRDLLAAVSDQQQRPAISAAMLAPGGRPGGPAAGLEVYQYQKAPGPSWAVLWLPVALCSSSPAP